MDKSPIEALAERVESLERQCGAMRRMNRRWKRLGLAALAGVVAVVFSGADAGKVIEAERVVLRDKGGRVRASLEVKQNGEPCLRFFDEKGETGVDLEIDPEIGSGLSLSSKEGKSSLNLVAQHSGAAHLSVSVEDGRSAMLLATGKDDNSAELSLGKPSGPDRLAVGVHDEDAWVRLVAGAENSERSLSMSAGKDGSADLSFGDKDEASRFVLGGKKDGSSFLKMLDGTGKVSFEAPKP